MMRDRIVRKVCVGFFCAAFLAQTNMLHAKDFFVDSERGSDSSPGTSPESPWRSVARVRKRRLSAGDIVHFRCGGTWVMEQGHRHGISITGSGAEGRPIVLTSYGSGEKPVLTNPDDGTRSSCAILITGSWVIIDGLHLKDNGSSGVAIRKGSAHNIVRNCEFSNCGNGVGLGGQYNLVTHNYFHDFHIIRNTDGSKDKKYDNDDYGAVAVTISGSNNEVCYNRMVNCIDKSYDYGVDGGAVEFWSSVENVYVHHNWAEHCDGFLEVGGRKGDYCRNIVMAYNIQLNCGVACCIHTSGHFGVEVKNFRIENNTIVEREKVYAIFGVDEIPGGLAGALVVRNNIVVVAEHKFLSNAKTFAHSNNVFFCLRGRLRAGFDMGEGDTIADPRFVNLEANDFHLLPDSPAINRGTQLGYILDHENYPLSPRNIPDAGAYEFHGGRPLTFTPLPIQPKPAGDNLFIHAYAMQEKGILRVFAGNSDTEAHDVQIAWPPALTGVPASFKVLFEKRKVTVVGNAIHDHFQPFQCRVYQYSTRKAGRTTTKPDKEAESKKEEELLALGRSAAPELRKWVIEGVASGRKLSVYVTIMGANTRARITAADKTGILVAGPSGKTEVPWDDVSASQLYKMAKKYAAPKGRPVPSERKQLLEAFALAHGLDD